MVVQRLIYNINFFSGLSSLQISSATPWLLLDGFNYVMMLDETTSVCSNTTAKCDSFRD